MKQHMTQHVVAIVTAHGETMRSFNWVMENALKLQSQDEFDEGTATANRRALAKKDALVEKIKAHLLGDGADGVNLEVLLGKVPPWVQCPCFPIPRHGSQIIN